MLDATKNGIELALELPTLKRTQAAQQVNKIWKLISPLTSCRSPAQ